MEYENNCVPESGLRERLYQMLFEGIHVAMFYCHTFCTASACPSIWMNIILQCPVIHKLPAPARSYRAGLNWAWVIQPPSEAGLIIPPYAVAVNISEAMPLVVEQVSSAHSVQSKWSNLIHHPFKTAADHHWHRYMQLMLSEECLILFFSMSFKIDTSSLKIANTI